MSRSERLYVKSIQAGRTRRILSSRTQPRFLRMAVRDLPFAFAGAPPLGFKGGTPFITSRPGDSCGGHLQSLVRVGTLIK